MYGPRQFGNSCPELPRVDAVSSSPSRRSRGWPKRPSCGEARRPRASQPDAQGFAARTPSVDDERRRQARRDVDVAPRQSAATRPPAQSPPTSLSSKRRASGSFRATRRVSMALRKFSPPKGWEDLIRLFVIRVLDRHVDHRPLDQPLHDELDLVALDAAQSIHGVVPGLESLDALEGAARLADGDAT